MHPRIAPRVILILALALSILISGLTTAAPSAGASPNETVYQAFNCPAQVPLFSSPAQPMATSGWWNFRIAPYTGSCTLIRTLPPGTAVQVTGTAGEWSYVHLSATNEEGWIHSGGLTVNLGTPGPPTGYLATASHGGCSIQVDSSIAAHVTALLTEAHNSGFNGLCGWGWRSPDSQIALRRQNCGTSFYATYQMPSWMCSPPTAIPGTSNHERGLAIDFYTGFASSISAAEFDWLSRNARRFGLYNLPSERWHWSTNGR